MSYARFSFDSDVYIFAHVGGGFECCGCRLGPLVKSVFTEGCKDHPLFGNTDPCDKCNGEGCGSCTITASQNFKTRSAMIDHLKDHIKAGHKVPSHAIESLEKEIEKEGEENKPMFDDGYSGPVAIDFRKGIVTKLTDLFREEKE